jgi:hypothetical protein
MRQHKYFSALLFIVLALPSCASQTRVIAVTGTNIGVEISQNPANQTPQAKLGYQRSEIALVPTNRPIEDPSDKKTKGAEDTAEVLMELKYAGIFSWGASGGIYQRLAVGKIAVTQPGAALMFSRNVTGDVGDDTAKAATDAAVRSSSNIAFERSSGDLDAQRQVQVDNVLGLIDSLEPAKAQLLADTPPVKGTPTLDSLIDGAFPKAKRDVNGDGKVDSPDVAKKMLKMRAVMAEKNDADLQAWKAALTANK